MKEYKVTLECKNTKKREIHYMDEQNIKILNEKLKKEFPNHKILATVPSKDSNFIYTICGNCNEEVRAGVYLMRHLKHCKAKPTCEFFEVTTPINEWDTAGSYLKIDNTVSWDEQRKIMADKFQCGAMTLDVAGRFCDIHDPNNQYTIWRLNSYGLIPVSSEHRNDIQEFLEEKGYKFITKQ